MASFLHTLVPIVVLPAQETIVKKTTVQVYQEPSIQKSTVEQPVEEVSTSTKLTQNGIWGPLLWRILHILAEQVGKPKHPITQTDEVQKWIQFMKSVEATMPCALCRGHYKEWISKHPLNELALLRGQAFREATRKYVWQLHENVNTDRNISSGISLEACKELYGSCDTLQSTIDKFAQFIQEIISSGKFKGEGFTEFRKQLTLLRKLADCI